MVVALMHIGLIGGLGFLIRKQETGDLKFFFWPALIFKLGCGLGLGLLYTYYYTAGDTFNYFADGSALARLARSDFGAYLRFMFVEEERYRFFDALTLREPRAIFLSLFTSVLVLVTDGRYWLTSIYFSFLSFAGAWYLVTSVSRVMPRMLPAAVLAFLLFPSVVFWTSGLIKESIAVGSLYFLTGLFLRWWYGKTPGPFPILAGILAAWMLWNLKYYFAAIFFPVALAGILYRLFLRNRAIPPLWQVMMWILLFITPLALVSFLHPNFHPGRFFIVIVTNYQAYASISSPAEMIHYDNLEPRFLSIVRHAPWALFSGLFRPFPWEGHHLLQVVAGVENLVIFGLAVSSTVSVRDILKSDYRLLILGALAYVLLLCVFITLSTPNFGTLSRYRTGYLPYFLFLVSCHPPTRGILERWWDKVVRKS